MSENQKYISGKEAQKHLNVSQNTLRRWANNGQINYIRNSEKGKRFYNIESLIVMRSKPNTHMTTQLTKKDSENNLNIIQKNKKKIERIFNKPKDQITNITDDINIDYKYLNQLKSIYCYCKVFKKNQNNLLEEQKNKLYKLYDNCNLICVTSNNELDWHKNKILYLLKEMKDNKILKLIINDSEFIGSKLLSLLTDLCELYKITMVII